MRMRRKPYARPELAAWPQAVNEPTKNKGVWKTAFENPALPLRLELGCGKGGFLAALAGGDAQHNYLGLDIKSEVLVVAKRNIERAYAQTGREADNVLITGYNIEKIDEVLAAEDAVERIYINFCNPWYKPADAKHRLTHPRQLAKYRAFLQEGGEIHFKTDDEPLYKDSLRYFPLCGFEVVWCTEDLHREEPAWNIRTEHEQMFSAEGIPIKGCIARKIEKELDMNKISRLKKI